MLEEDFDKDPERAKKRRTSQKQDKDPRDLKMQEVRHNEEMFARSLSYNIQQTSGNIICCVVFVSWFYTVLITIYYEVIRLAFCVF